MTMWFSSDQHFGHKNIIQYCNRPFDTIEEMDAVLIRNWNDVVRNNDVVFLLGDFTLGDFNTAISYFSQLKGEIYILSNPHHHDKRWLKQGNIPGVTILPPIEVLEIYDTDVEDEHPLAITLCHYPIAEWDRKHYGAWHLHGHSHGRYKYPDGELAYDVGVDNNGFYPISFEQIQKIMCGRKQT